MKTWQRILWFTIGLLTGIFWSALSYAAENGEQIRIEISATVTNASEIELIEPEEEEITVYDPDTFYTVSEEIIDGVKTVTVNY